MTHTEFVSLVKKMRDAQKNYFRLNTSPEKTQWLNESKKREREVDIAIKDIDEAMTSPKLF